MNVYGSPKNTTPALLLYYLRLSWPVVRRSQLPKSDIGKTTVEGLGFSSILQNVLVRVTLFDHPSSSRLCLKHKIHSSPAKVSDDVFATPFNAHSSKGPYGAENIINTLAMTYNQSTVCPQNSEPHGTR